jgi:hypothetical protein
VGISGVGASGGDWDSEYSTIQVDDARLASMP